jgi:hypothetical protein
LSLPSSPSRVLYGVYRIVLTLDILREEEMSRAIHATRIGEEAQLRVLVSGKELDYDKVVGYDALPVDRFVDI